VPEVRSCCKGGVGGRPALLLLHRPILGASVHRVGAGTQRLLGRLMAC
jgi:hypothetical protein